MEKYLQKYGKVDGVWAGDDDVLIGALKAYKESKRKDVQVFVGGGGSKTIVKMVKENDPLVKATVTYPPRMIETGADLALKGLRNNKKNLDAKEVVVKSEIVTSANADKHYFPDSLY
jgi:ribose transport system substrate-binding protein